jgi:hypothetical protein
MLRSASSMRVQTGARQVLRDVVGALLFLLLLSVHPSDAAVITGQDAEWFMPTQYDMNQFFNMNLAQVGSSSTVASIVTETPVTKDGHSCLVDIAVLNVKVGGDTYVFNNRVYWCADGYMGTVPPLDFSNKDVWLVVFIVGMGLLFGSVL